MSPSPFDYMLPEDQADHMPTADDFSPPAAAARADEPTVECPVCGSGDKHMGNCPLALKALVETAKCACVTGAMSDESDEFHCKRIDELTARVEELERLEKLLGPHWQEDGSLKLYPSQMDQHIELRNMMERAMGLPITNRVAE